MSIKQNMIDEMRELTIVRAGLNRKSAFDEAISFCITLINARMEGYTIVPDELTPEMIHACSIERLNQIHSGEVYHKDALGKLKKDWKALLTAAKEQQ